MISTISRLSTAATATAAVVATPPVYRLLQLSRFHGAAQPQPQLDLDNYYSYRSEPEPCRNQLIRLSPVADTEGAVPLRGVQWAFIGSPRAKKHVYADMLSKLLEVPHISMASLVRQELNPWSAIYREIAKAVNHGELVGENIIFGLVSKRLEDGYCRGETGFILDGIPRSRIQAEILDQLAEIDLVVNFKCTEDTIVKTQGEASWKERLQDCKEQSKQLEDYYRKQKKLLDFQVSIAPVETWQGLLTALHLQHMHATHPLMKLTAGLSFP
ncbi:hypothetical protein SLA2020_251590 [Shorea laevis]